MPRAPAAAIPRAGEARAPILYTQGMIPLRDVIPSRTTPYVTVGLIAVNALAFGVELSLPAASLQRFLREFGIVPAEFAWPTLLSSMFLHGGWLHVIGNMWYLWIFGDNVEDRMGHGRYLVFYLLCGGLAGLAQTLVNPDSYVPTIGASGAIAGVMGAYFVLYPHSRVLTLIPLFIFIEIVEIPALYFLGFWFLMQLFAGAGSIAQTSGSQGGIAFWAHVAGFVAGLAGVFVFRRPERTRVEWWNRE
jgi:membrane associated rhomboid family serine protease